MQMTRQAEYALRTIYHLSKQDPHQRSSTKSIAEAQNIPSIFLSKIIKTLAVAGLVHTFRGARGGVLLASPPSNISVLDVVVAIDGPIVLHDCGEDLENCEWIEDCPLHQFFCETQALLVDRLQKATFDQFGPVDTGFRTTDPAIPD